MPSIKGTASVSDDHAMTKLLKSTKFPASFGTKVHLSKINKPVLSQWIEQQISKILGFEDEIVSSTAINLFLDGTTVDPRRAQLDLAGFLGEDQAAGFAESLWDMLVDAQAGSTGIPTKLLEEKKLELAKQQQLLQQQQQMQRDRHARGPPPHGRHPPQQHPPQQHHENNNNHNNHDVYNRGGEPRRRYPPDVRQFDRRPPVPHYNDRPPPPRGYPPGRRDERERRDRVAVPVSPPSEDRKPAARDEFGREMKEDGPPFRPLPPPPAHMDRDDHIRDQRPKDRERRRRREESSSSSEESSEESDESRHVNRRRRTTTRRSPDDSSDDDRHRRHRSDDRRRYRSRSRSRERRSTNHRREADRPRSSRSRRERSYSPSDDDDDGDSDE